MKTTSEIFDYLFNKYQQSLESSFQSYDLWALIILASIIAQTICFMLIIVFKFSPILRNEVLESRGMLKLIPKEILRNNKRIRSILLQGKEDAINQRKRRNRFKGNRY